MMEVVDMIHQVKVINLMRTIILIRRMQPIRMIYIIIMMMNNKMKTHMLNFIKKIPFFLLVALVMSTYNYLIHGVAMPTFKEVFFQVVCIRYGYFLAMECYNILRSKFMKTSAYKKYLATKYSMQKKRKTSVSLKQDQSQA